MEVLDERGRKVGREEGRKERGQKGGKEESYW